MPSNTKDPAERSRVKRRDPELAAKYQKNAADEVFLETMNDALASAEESAYREMPEAYPTLLIVGVPRSGTTLISQLVSTHLNVGYINNLIAAFWQAPVTGIRLSKKLLGDFRDSSFASDFGRTHQLWEPHEFGYFWSKHLQRADMAEPEPAAPNEINWMHLKTVLNNMCAAFDAPIVFKSMLPGWYLRDLSQLMNRLVVVRIRRDPIDNACSLLKLRQEYNGSVDNWGAIRPLEYTWLQHQSLEEQLLGQVYFVEAAHTQGLATIPSHRVLETTYDELCDSPRVVLDAVSHLLTTNGGSVAQVGEPPQSFAKSLPSRQLSTLRENLEAVKRTCCMGEWSLKASQRGK